MNQLIIYKRVVIVITIFKMEYDQYLKLTIQHLSEEQGYQAGYLLYKWSSNILNMEVVKVLIIKFLSKN